jgi:hypothetical protein
MRTWRLSSHIPHKFSAACPAFVYSKSLYDRSIYVSSSVVTRVSMSPHNIDNLLGYHSMPRRKIENVMFCLEAICITDGNKL